MKRILLFLIALQVAAVVGNATALSDKTLLLTAYFRVLLVQQVPAQAQPICGQLAEQDAAQVQAALTAWAQARTTEIRQELANRFGEQTRKLFEQFATAYAEAESKQDVLYLKQLTLVFSENLKVYHQ